MKDQNAWVALAVAWSIAMALWAVVGLRWLDHFKRHKVQKCKFCGMPVKCTAVICESHTPPEHR